MEAGYTSDELEAAIEELSSRESFERAEQAVAAAAPGLQRILAQALASGGWFEESHESEIRKACELEDPGDRLEAVRTLAAEEARLGMMVGAAVGWALAERLRGPRVEPRSEKE